MIVRRLPDSELELYHHGIMGMRWGVRRFQNKDGTLTSAGRKRRGLVEQIKYNRKMKKVRRAKVDKAKEKQRKAEELQKARQKSQAERKERAEVIKTGSAKDIRKFQHKMSDKEYEQALQRVKYNQILNDYAAQQSQAKMEKMQARLNSVMNVARTVGDVANSAANVYTSLERVGIIKKKEKETSLDKLRNKRDRMSLELDIKDLEYQQKQQKERKRPDELDKWQREAQITKAIADVTKNNRIISGEDMKQKGSNINIDELSSAMEDILNKRGL